MVNNFKNHVRDAIVNKCNTLIKVADNIVEDIDQKNVSEVYITIRIDIDGTSAVEIMKTYGS